MLACYKKATTASISLWLWGRARPLPAHLPNPQAIIPAKEAPKC